MKRSITSILGLTMMALGASAQATFTVTGTLIPAPILNQNYGKMPKGIGAYDLSICNDTKDKQSVVSSEIFQALSSTTPGLQPIGRQIMLASILRNQNVTASGILTIVLNAATGVLGVLNTSGHKVPSGLATTAAIGSLALPQIMNSLKPVLPADKLEKFESQVLEPALVLDGGSCVERTVFAEIPSQAAGTKGLDFHVR